MATAPRDNASSSVTLPRKGRSRERICVVARKRCDGAGAWAVVGGPRRGGPSRKHRRLAVLLGRSVVAASHRQPIRQLAQPGIDTPWPAQNIHPPLVHAGLQEARADRRLHAEAADLVEPPLPAFLAMAVDNGQLLRIDDQSFRAGASIQTNGRVE